MATWQDVRRLALALPETTEQTSHGGTRAWAVRGKIFARERPLRRSDLAALGADAPKGPILAIRTADLELKEALLAANAGVFFTTPHFDGYAAVLVRLDAIAATLLRQVLVEGWLAQAPPRVATEFLAASKQRVRRLR